MTEVIVDGADGSKIRCSILDIFEFCGNQYAMLLKSEDETLVIVRMKSADDETKFVAIESEEEFESVLRFVQELAKQNRDGEDEDEE
ncbi:MAG: DUF1292 domain-containing protein [Pirellula sp.]